MKNKRSSTFRVAAPVRGVVLAGRGVRRDCHETKKRLKGWKKSRYGGGEGEVRGEKCTRGDDVSKWYGEGGEKKISKSTTQEHKS